MRRRAGQRPVLPKARAACQRDLPVLPGGEWKWTSGDNNLPPSCSFFLVSMKKRESCLLFPRPATSST